MLTGERGHFWLQFTNTIVWTVACVLFHYAIGLGLAVMLNRASGAAGSTGCC